MANTCRQCGPGGCMGHGEVPADDATRYCLVCYRPVATADAPVLIEGAPVPCPACDQPVRESGDCGCDDSPEAGEIAPETALSRQEGGDHYKRLAIQPAVYCYRNRLDYLSSRAITYLTRWPAKNGLEDLRKARHCIDLLIELEADRG